MGGFYTKLILFVWYVTEAMEASRAVRLVLKFTGYRAFEIPDAFAWVPYPEV